MKKTKWKWIVGGIFALLIIVIAGVILYMRFALPSIPLKEVRVDGTPGQIERGAYLANHVLVCMDCHSTRDWEKFSGPLKPGTLGIGGEVFDQKLGFPGTFTSKNITPFNLKEWTDAEIYRAITSGVNKQGKALFPVMPYLHYGTLDDKDIFSVIAYLRTLPVIESHPGDSKPSFPMNLIMNTIPKVAKTENQPPQTDTLNYGKYLVRAAGCIECHTPVIRGQIIPDRAFSGGRVFQMPDGSLLQSPNITPDGETGIGRWSKQAFILRFKGYDLKTFVPPVVMKGQMQSIMPWTMYGGMDTTDLGAIFKYLHNLAPIHNKVVKSTLQK